MRNPPKYVELVKTCERDPAITKLYSSPTANLIFLSIAPVFDYTILDEIHKDFARRIIVEAEQMPL